MKMEEQLPGDGSQKEGSRGTRKSPRTGKTDSDPERVSVVQVKQEPDKPQLQRWEVRWQQFLRTVDSPHAAGVIPQSAEEATPWDDAETFLGSFEQVAEACRWPKEAWVARLLPALQGEPRQTFCRLEARDREDYGKVKAAILRGDALSREKQRQHFRCFCYQEAEGPLGTFTQLQDLCSQWLKVNRHSKEQILELLVLEQFLAILPPEIQNWVQECGPRNCSEAVALAEDFLSKQRQAKRWEHQALTKFTKATTSPVKATLVAACPEERPVQNEMVTKQDQEARVFEPPRPVSTAEAAVWRTRLHICSGCIQLPVSEGRILEDSELMEDKGNILECSRLAIENRISQRRRADSASPLGNERTISGSHSVAKRSPRHRTRESRPDLANETRVGHNQGPPCELEGFGEDLRLSDQEQAPNQDAPCQHSGLRERSLPRYQQIHVVMEEPGQGSHGRKTAGRFLHEGTCAEKPPFPCPTCGKCFSRNSLLLKHEKTHGGEKPYSCSACGKSFVYSWNLMKHKKKHTGEKPHRCSACGKTFFERSDLLRHERTHTGEKPYHCSHCWRRFSQKWLLLKHERTHVG